MFAPLIGFLIWSAALLVSSPAMADQWDSVPELEGRDHLAVMRGIDGPRYNSTRLCLRRFSSMVDADYYAALVRVTNPSGERGRDHDDAADYAKRVAEVWSEEGDIDPETAVVFGFGAWNRSGGAYVGDRWRRMGLDPDVLRAVVEISPARRSIRRGNFDDAACELAESVDYLLATVEIEYEQNLDAAESLLESAEDRFNEVRTGVEENLPADHALRTSLDETLSEAESLLDVEEHLEEVPHEVIDDLERVTALSDDVERRLDAHLARTEPLDALEDDIEKAIARLEQRGDRNWRGPTEAAETLDECQHIADEARTSKDPDLLAIRQCIDRAEGLLERSDVRHFFLARAIPGGGFAIVVLLTLTYAVARFRRRLRAVDTLKHDLSAWEQGLENSRRKLERLENDYAWYFDERQQFWQGEHAETDRTVADGINRAFLLCERGTGLLEEARRMYDAALPVEVHRLEKALRVLRRTSVALRSGDLEKSRPLALPLSNEYQIEASELLCELDRAYLAAISGLEEIAPLNERIAELTADGESLLAETKQAIEKRDRLDFPTDHLDTELQTIQRQWSRAIARAGEVPEEGIEALEAVIESLEKVHSRAAEGNRILSRIIDDVAELREAINDRIEIAEQRGIRFGDRTFAPSSVLENIDEQLEEIIELVATGRESKAAEQFDPLADELEQTAIRTEVCVEAGGVVDEMVDNFEAAVPELKEEIFPIRMRIKKLVNEVEDREILTHLERVDRLQKLVSRLERFAVRIERDFENGKILGACANMTAVAELIDTGTDSLEVVKQFIKGDDAPPAIPGESPWQPPPHWEDHPARMWGNSEDAEQFRTLSIP